MIACLIFCGNSCYVDTSSNYKASNKEGNKYYTCPKGGNLNGKNCEVNTLIKSYQAKSSTSDVTTYEYKWSTEQTLEGWEATGEKRVINS